VGIKNLIMKTHFLLLLLAGVFACNQNQTGSKTTDFSADQTDIQAELSSIEETRSAFILAIKEKRYGDLEKYTTPDMKAVSPGGDDWLEYKRLREKPIGQFSYDSIRMRPIETVVVSDSIAYDFGTSSVYYTNEIGETVELQNTFLVILKKDKNDGVWKLHREVSSSVVE
jgi:ketosteroid isomerase-like protein